MLGASFSQLNTEFGYALALAPAPTLARFHADIDLIAHNYGRTSA